MNVQIVKQNTPLTENVLLDLPKEELIRRINALTAHNNQLKSIIAKNQVQGKKVQTTSKSFDFTKCAFRKVLLKFMYLGWDYHGYVVQEDTTNTVEHHLFEALVKTCLIKSRAESNYNRCGRTDKGVSSYGQVISLDIRSKLPEHEQDNIHNELDYCTMLNRVLPSDIQCIAWSPISDELFSARFNCKSRVYKYFFFKGELDIEKMRLGASYLIGSHDYRNFCKMDVGNGVVNFTRCIKSINIDLFNKCDLNAVYDTYIITFEGQAFLWHQIRCILGILFLIGQNRESPVLVKELLDVERNPRKPDYNMASEIPLNLFECNYETDEISWQYSDTSLNMVLNNLRDKLTYSSTRTNMLMYMINDLERKSNQSTVTFFTDFLLQGAKTKKYVPVMKRQKCDSLEDKIDHFTKRRRIEVKDNC